MNTFNHELFLLSIQSYNRGSTIAQGQLFICSVDNTRLLRDIIRWECSHQIALLVTGITHSTKCSLFKREGVGLEPAASKSLEGQCERIILPLWRWKGEVLFSSFYRWSRVTDKSQVQGECLRKQGKYDTLDPSYSHRSGQAVLQKTHMNPDTHTSWEAWRKGNRNMGEGFIFHKWLFLCARSISQLAITVIFSTAF